MSRSRRSRKKLIVFLLIVVVACAGILGWPSLRQTLMVGTGYAAKRMCSEVYVAGRDAQGVWDVDLALLPLPILSYSMEPEQKIAMVSSLGLVEQTAVWREGLGCTLTNGTTVEEARAMAVTHPEPTPLSEVQQWPFGTATSSTPPKGVDTTKLAAALDIAFEEPDLAEHPRRTRAVVVIHNGTLVAERYGAGFDRDTPLLSWSMGKSVTNTMIGVLAHQGKLDIKSPAPVPEWKGDERARITVDDIMRMRSGLAFDETYGAFGDVTDMLFVAHSSAARAANSPLREGETVWSYSSGDTNLLSRIVRDVIGDDEVYHHFPTTEIFHKIGAHSAIFETDPAGTFVGSSFVYMTARDWARWGQLYLQDGVWQGERILPQGWTDYSCELTPGTPLGEYGAQFWLNRGNPEDSAQRKYPSVPTDYCAAHGYETQRVAIIPSKNAVIVRLGLTPGRGDFPDDEFFAAVLDALPDAEPDVVE